MSESIPETPPEEMSMGDLREEYCRYDTVALRPDEPEWERHLELWQEMETREEVDFPVCPESECDCRRWRFETGGPAACAECGAAPPSVEFSERVHDAAQRLIYGGDGQ